MQGARDWFPRGVTLEMEALASDGMRFPAVP